MPMEKIDEESEDSIGTLQQARLRKLEDDLGKEKRLRDKIERYCNEHHCGHDAASHQSGDTVTWQMFRQREAEVSKLRTKIELAMNSHEEAMTLAKLQFTQELDRLQNELSGIKEPHANLKALDCAKLNLVKYTSQTVLGSPFLPNEEASVSTIEANFANRKLEIELEETQQEKTSLEFEIKKIRVRLSEETRAKEIFEEQLRKATDELDVMHKKLDEEEQARIDLKRSLKAAAAELDEWKAKHAESSSSSERKLSIRMQEIDEAIQKAEFTSLSMDRVKVREDNIAQDVSVSFNATPDKGRRSKTSDFAIEQELQEFKIKFADSEQQLTAWKRKFEELGYVRDSLEEKVELKNDQIKKWEKTCEELNNKLIEMEKVRQQKIALEEKIRQMTQFVERTEGLIDDLEKAENEKAELRGEIKVRDDQISALEDSRMDLNDEIARLNGQISECEGKIDRLNSENERLSITLEGIRSSFDLQGLGKSALEQKVHQLNARLVEIQAKYVNEQQEKQELRRIFRESTMGVVQLKAKVECEKIRNINDFHELKMVLIQRLTDTENVFTEAQQRARKELPVHQQSRRASVGLLPAPPALPDKTEYEVLEWKEKYDEICREIERAEDEVKDMNAQVAKMQVELEQTNEDLDDVTDSKSKTEDDFSATKQELDDLREEMENLKGYNGKLNEEILKLNGTIGEMENAFEDDANSKIVELSDLRNENEDLKNALKIVSEEAEKIKEQNFAKSSRTKQAQDEVESLTSENEDLLKQKRDLEWKLKNLGIDLEEKTKALEEVDAEFVAAEKRIKELQRALEDSRTREGDPKRIKETEQKMNDLKTKLKEEKERAEEMEEEVGKLKKKLKDVKAESEDEIAAKTEEIMSLKQEAKEAAKTVKDSKLAVKDAAAAKEIAEEELKSLTKKLRDATIKLEEFSRDDKYSADALQSHQLLNKQIRDLQAQLDEEVKENQRANKEITELRNKMKGVKLSDSELEVQIKELKSDLDKEQSAHKDTNDELLNVRRMLKEARKNLDEEKSGVNKKKALRLQESVDEFKSALEEEKVDHANTNNLLSEIQRELNEANKKISRLRNEVEDGADNEKDVNALQRRIKSLEKSLAKEQEDHEQTDQELQETRNELKSANWKISDLEAQLEASGPSLRDGGNETKELRRKVKELQDMLSEERAEHDQTEKKLRRAKNDLDNARQQLNDHRSNGPVLNQELDNSLEEKLKELEEALEEERSNFQRATKKLQKAEEQLKEAQRDIYQLQATDDAKMSKDKKELTARIAELELTIEERDATIDELDNALKEEKNRNKKAKSDLREMQDGKEDMQKSLNKKIATLDADIQELESSIEDQNDANSKLQSALDRAERQRDAAKEELEEFKKLQDLDEDNEVQGIGSLRKKLENLHTALDEEMAAHEETQAELDKVEQKLKSAQKRIDELHGERREGDEKLAKTTMNVDLKVKNLEDELENEKNAHEKTLDQLSDFRKKHKVVCVELENIKSNLPQDIVDGITTGSANEKIEELEKALEKEREAHEESLADLESTQKKLKTVRVQLNALKAENEGSATGGTKYTSELKVQLKNLQNALDEEVAAHEETERDLAILKKEFYTYKTGSQDAGGKSRRYSSASVTLSKGLANQIDKQMEDLEEKNEALMKENEKFRVEIQVVRAENNTLDQAFNEIEVKYKGGLVTIQDLEETKNDLEEENAELKGVVQDLESDLAELRSGQMPSQEKVRRRSAIPADGPERKELIAENKRLKQRVTDLEDELEEIKRKSRKPKIDEDEAAALIKEMEAQLNEALTQLEAVEEVLDNEEAFRSELKNTLKDTTKEIDGMKNEYEKASGETEQSSKLIKLQRRFGTRMSDLEDAIGESQIHIKSVDKYKTKVSELAKELRAFLDQVGDGQGMSAYKWKAKYEAMLLQFQRSEKELAATREELTSLTREHETTTVEIQQYRRDNRQLRDRIDELLEEIERLKKIIAELEADKRKLEREVEEQKIAIEELRKTLDSERLIAETKIAELTELRNSLQKELAEKDDHIERITKSYERQIRDLKEDLELERQALADYAKHKARMTDLLAQLQAQIEVLSASNSEFSKNNRKLQIRLKDAVAACEDERVCHEHTRQALARAEKRYRECFKQIDLLREGLERAERMKKNFAGEAEDSHFKLNNIELRTADLESLRLRNVIEIDNMKADIEEMEIKVRISDERARNAVAELNEVNLNLKKYMELEGEMRRARDNAEKELRETQIRLSGLEDVDVKQLKNTVKNLQRQNAELEEDLSSILHQTKGFQRFEERYERRVTTLEIELEEWKNAAEVARAENEALQIKMKKMRAQLESAESSAMILTSRYKHAQVDVEDATERADAAVKALMYKTRGLDFIEGKVTTDTRTIKIEHESEFTTSPETIQLSSRSPSRR
ncbi:golgin subfamily B member 1-like isoform X1 [Rhopilema esculentum]|uniref:golgin subfamily B member 1-like isoform X1 n=1 Tax=Rhopilema esculentum TaxID=499914 RepID=UPI0031DE48A0